MPNSLELMTVHLPVPFWPAVSRILSTSGWPSVSLKARISRRDFDEVGIQFGLVPFGKDLLHLGGGHAQAVFHQLIGLADQLHVAVFDAVVDHFDVMARAVFAHPIATRRAVLDLGGDALENILDVRPGRRRAAGHDGRAVPRAFLAAGNAGADEQQPLAFQILDAAVGVLEKRIAAVDDDVARFQVAAGFPRSIHPPACPALTMNMTRRGRLSSAANSGNGMGADDLGALGFAPRNSSTLATVRLKTATVKPWSFMLRMRFWPMTASPINPMSAWVP